MAAGHRPVMLEEAVDALRLGPEDSVVDATFGGGGHSRLILDTLGPRRQPHRHRQGPGGGG